MQEGSGLLLLRQPVIGRYVWLKFARLLQLPEVERADVGFAHVRDASGEHGIKVALKRSELVVSEPLDAAEVGYIEHSAGLL